MRVPPWAISAFIKTGQFCWNCRRECVKLNGLTGQLYCGFERCRATRDQGPAPPPEESNIVLSLWFRGV